MMSDDESSRRRDWEEIRCSIGVFSDTVTARDVTALVGIEPTRQRVKGEPVSASRPNIPVASHLWVWKPDDSVEPSLEAQLDALWAALGSRAESFKNLSPEAKVQLDIWIVHHGRHLTLGWVLGRQHVATAAAFGASLNVDEYDDTEIDDPTDNPSKAD